jgi:hypothetical protein
VESVLVVWFWDNEGDADMVETPKTESWKVDYQVSVEIPGQEAVKAAYWKGR